jgi:transcriptional regulator of acetoin/glycerol metabolism
MGSMLFTIMAALLKWSTRSNANVSLTPSANAAKPEKTSPAGPVGSDSQIRSALHLVEGGQPAAQVARDLGMSRATFYRRSRALTARP